MTRQRTIAACHASVEDEFHRRALTDARRFARENPELIEAEWRPNPSTSERVASDMAGRRADPEWIKRVNQEWEATNESR